MINPKSVVPQEYHLFFSIFSKKNSDTLFSHWKYNDKIYLEKEQKPVHALLYKISLKKLDTIKWYLDSQLIIRFI